jgi:predicted DNA-binding ribbon-helix-helix protein
MNNNRVTRTVSIDGFKTSIALEQIFWDVLDDICHRQNKTLSRLVFMIDSLRENCSRTSALRMLALQHSVCRMVSPAAESAISRKFVWPQIH